MTSSMNKTNILGFNLAYVLEGAKLIIVETWGGGHLAGQERD